MQFFIDSQGTVVNLISSPVYQGSTNACELVLVAPFSSANTVTAYFRLPNGMATTERIMLVQNQPMQIEGMTFNTWRLLLGGDITEYAGKVTVQFSVYQGNPNGMLPIKPTLYAGTFFVTPGVTPMPSETPTDDDGYNIYQAILQYLSQINPQFDIKSISYSAPSDEKIDTDTAVSGLTKIPTDAITKVDSVKFEINNIDGSQAPYFFAIGQYYNEDTGFTITFANPTEIGKMQIEFSLIYDSVLLKVIADRGLNTEREITSFRVQSVAPINTIVAVNDTVQSISIIQPWTENVGYDTNYSPVTDKGYTNGRYYVDSIDMWKPNTNGQITITSSTGRTIVFPDGDFDAYVSQVEALVEQAQASEQSANNSASQATSALDEILSKAGQVGGYPILADIDGQPKIPSVYIQQVDIKDYIQITSESELATINAQVGDVAVLVSTVDGETTVTKSWILLSVTDNTRNWAVYGTSYASNAGNALFSQNSADSQKVNGLTINGVLSEAEYNALASKQGVYFVSIEGETNGN